MDFIYRGSVNIPHDMVETINQVADLLAIRGIVTKESNTKQVGYNFKSVFFILLLSGTQSSRFIAKSLSILSLNVSVFWQFHKKQVCLLFDSYLFKFWLVFSQNVGPFALPLYTQVYKW